VEAERSHCMRKFFEKRMKLKQNMNEHEESIGEVEGKQLQSKINIQD